jgi:DNA-binding transcriptional MerR regulator
LYFGGKNLIKEKAIFEELDTEWMKLILEALEMGLNKEEIRDFLNNNQSHALGQQN